MDVNFLFLLLLFWSVRLQAQIARSTFVFLLFLTASSVTEPKDERLEHLCNRSYKLSLASRSELVVAYSNTTGPNCVKHHLRRRQTLSTLVCVFTGKQHGFHGDHGAGSNNDFFPTLVRMPSDGRPWSDVWLVLFKPQRRKSEGEPLMRDAVMSSDVWRHHHRSLLCPTTNLEGPCCCTPPPNAPRLPPSWTPVPLSTN